LGDGETKFSFSAHLNQIWYAYTPGMVTVIEGWGWGWY